MTRTAIYARYSTDLQRDASIEDQIRLCEKKVRDAGGQVYQSYTDHAVSGASLMRPGIQMLMQDAAAGRFDQVYAEALDRISRDQEDIAAVYKRLVFAGVKLVTYAEGEINELHIGMKGTMNALFLSDLRKKTHRGLVGKVEKGLSGGGKCYGYDIVSGDERGHRTINDAQATIVRRIFEEYAAGKSPKAIAMSLNKEGVPGPTGNSWGQSTINGNRQRGTGILNNELYIGRLVWNRLTYMKNPETGKRVSKLNPEADWIIQDVADLLIVDEELWQQAKDRQRKLDKKGKTFWTKQRPRNLFSGLIKCGECGGGFSMVSQTHTGCSNARNKGTCSNKRTMKRENLEQDVLGALKHYLMDDELCGVFCEEYTKHMNKLRREHDAAFDFHREELQRVKKRLSQMVDAIADGAPVAPIKDKMHELENRRVHLVALLDNVEEAPPLLHPSMALRYREQLGKLIETMNTPEHRSEAGDIVRSLIEKIVLSPHESENRLVADLHGNLAGILTLAAGPKPTSQINDTTIAASWAALGVDPKSESAPEGASQDKLVAGVGFEPTTFRL
ncbi:recombinase family protein [Roseovarius nubinhibens]|uniref:Resolvase n=1 Tax=Roseovarius nubinhibens (strain ATCC BAA-591 / DSM 15170 / ISM) TaxID=89187 RepID=A3SLA2_ROSNI|nr:recombinase family protein [Roseovarius nubinhibens]EAP78133.1 resolvase [Roseovarius nubinhibens ISM]